MFAMSTGKCCCNCEDCCNGSFPSEFDVTIAITDDYCSICDGSLSATYTLAKVAGTCRWTYDTTASDYCLSPYSTRGTIKRIYLELGIYCMNATEYGIQLNMVVYRLPPGFPDLAFYYVPDQYSWAVYNVAYGDFACSSETDYALPAYTKACGNSPCLCDNVDDALITSVP